MSLSKRATSTYFSTPEQQGLVQVWNASQFIDHVKTRKETALVAFVLHPGCIGSDWIKRELVALAAEIAPVTIAVMIYNPATMCPSDFECPVIQEYNIDRFPSCLFFHQGQSRSVYQGKPRSADMVTFVQHHLSTMKSGDTPTQ